MKKTRKKCFVFSFMYLFLVECQADLLYHKLETL